MAEEHDHTHESPFISESVVQARVCKKCGAYVSSRFLQEHLDFHSSVAQTPGEQLTLFA